MSAFDLIVRNADVATAGERFRADIGVRQGRIAALAEGLEAGTAQVTGEMEMAFEDTGALLVVHHFNQDEWCVTDRDSPTGLDNRRPCHVAARSHWGRQ